MKYVCYHCEKTVHTSGNPRRYICDECASALDSEEKDKEKDMNTDHLNDRQLKDLADEMCYQAYAHNRRASPHRTVEEWETIFPYAATMEVRFQREGGVVEKACERCDTPIEWEMLEYPPSAVCRRCHEEQEHTRDAMWEEAQRHEEGGEA